MGFLSFHQRYYAAALDRLESGPPGPAELYEAGQLLKLLDDLVDEGYPLLSRTLEETCGAVSRLHALLEAHHGTVFPIQKKLLTATAYGEDEVEPQAVCDRLRARVQAGVPASADPFLSDLRAYCRWLPHQSDTATVFLLRDAFLPYLYCVDMGWDDLYPWVINRDFLTQAAGDGADDLLRMPIYEALESGARDYAAFADFCLPRIRQALGRYPALERTLRELLEAIPAKKLLVVESGYCGTIPLTLAALDDRVDFRLYTTAPFLYSIYRDKIFCRRYEQIRSFETLYAQDALMRFSALYGGRFYVRTAADETVWARAAGEAAALLASP